MAWDDDRKACLKAFMEWVHVMNPELDMRSRQKEAIERANKAESPISAFEMFPPKLFKVAQKRWADFSQGWVYACHRANPAALKVGTFEIGTPVQMTKAACKRFVLRYGGKDNRGKVRLSDSAVCQVEWDDGTAAWMNNVDLEEQKKRSR